VREVAYVVSVLLVCLLSVAAMAWLTAYPITAAALWAQLLAVIVVAGFALLALHRAFSEADDEGDEAR
jgi:hypothetical protein